MYVWSRIMEVHFVLVPSLTSNPTASFHSQTRMDTAWDFRQAYETARKLKLAQDSYCAKVALGDWSSLAGETFPDDLQWEALVDVLRGKVKVQTHCYEAVDIANFIRVCIPRLLGPRYGTYLAT